MEATTARRPALIAVAIVLVVVAVAAFGVLRATGSSELAAADDAGADTSAPDAAATGGEPAPDVTFARADGAQASLADYRGQPLVLNFWASWCPPCVAEMGDALRPVHEAHGDSVAFLGMNLQDQPAEAQRILDATGVTYDLAVDPDGTVFAAFEGVGMPTTLFIDAEGRIVEKHTGIITREQLEQRVVALQEG